MKQSKFDMLVQCYMELSKQLKTVEHPRVKDLLASWEESFRQIDEFLTAKKVSKSQMVSGLRQGLRDLPDIFEDLPELEREKALKIYKSVASKYEISK